MFKTTLIASSAILFVACNNDPAPKEENADTEKAAFMSSSLNTLSEEEKNAGWELLFDGASLKGWHKYGDPSKAGAAWVVEDGLLHFNPALKKDDAEAGGDIVTDAEYGDFHLSLDWKVDSGGNSGIIFYVKEDKSKYEHTYNTGPEMQVLDNERHPDARIAKHRAGDLYDLISSSSEPVKPALEWNHAEIISKDGKLEFFLNGVNIVSTTMWDDNWKKMLENSKFKTMPDFGTFKTGRIALQDHGDNVWYRNIKIRKL